MVEGEIKNPSSSLALKPRQVLLSLMAKKQSESLLQERVLHYLHSNGFSKTLKRFLKETNTQGDTWKSCSPTLQDLYTFYLNSNTKSSDPEHDTDANNNDEKKKKSEGKNNHESHPDKNEGDVPSKKKKKKNIGDNDEVAEAKSENVVPLGNGGDGNICGNKSKKEKNKSKEANGEVDSKKKKRLASDENANGVEAKQSKRRKTEQLEESNVVVEQGKSDADNGHAGSGNGEVSHQDELNNSAKQKSASKRNGSAEPKTVNAFQRVKVDQVEFKDDRLKDNSYWAKDGADIGYGAKAQERLGQVKGRDFRHEKTKKKRGSYRGGQIDLQSHSVKFNYSDEE